MINFKEGCNELKAKFKQQFNLTDEDLMCGKGREEMLGKLQQKLGKKPDELDEIILKLSGFFNPKIRIEELQGVGRISSYRFFQAMAKL
jgi:hypothetical protein